MPFFLDDITSFYGNQERNASGQTLEAFLEAYNPKQYDQPSVTVDILVFRHPEPFVTVTEGLKLLMIKRGNHPSIGSWALPGGFVDMKEDAIDSAARELEEETGLSGLPIEQVSAWANWKRDPRTRVITLAHLALVKDSLPVNAGDDAADAAYFDVRFDLASQQMIEGRQIDLYDLYLDNQERNVTLHAVLQLSSSPHEILMRKEWTLIQDGKISSDHACLIADTLKYLETRLRDFKSPVER